MTKKNKKVIKQSSLKVTYTEDVCVPLSDKDVESLKSAFEDLDDIFSSDSEEEYEFRKKLRNQKN